MVHFSSQFFLLFALNVTGLFTKDDNDSCATPDYPRHLVEQDAAMSFTISQNGMTNFIMEGLQEADEFLKQVQVPDINMDINLGVTRVKFTLSNIQLQDLEVGGANGLLNGGDAIDASLVNCFLQLDFAWSFNQESYPYVHGSGTGKIILNGLDAYVTVSSAISDTCEGHLNFIINSASILFDTLDIKLEGDDAWVYQSIIDLILPQLQSTLESTISDLISTSIIDFMNSKLNKNGFYYPYNISSDIIKDDRFVSQLLVGYGTLSLLYSGYIYNMSNLTDEYINDTSMIHQAPIFQFDSEIQFGIDCVGFDNFYYIFNKYMQAYNYVKSNVDYNFTLVDAPKSSIQNTCVLTSYKYQVSDKNGNVNQYEFQLMGQPQQQTNNYSDINAGTRNVTQIYFSYNSTSLYYTDADQAVQQYFMDNVVPFLNEALKNCNYQIANTPFMDFNLLNWYFDSQYQHLRVYGDLPYDY